VVEGIAVPQIEYLTHIKSAAWRRKRAGVLRRAGELSPHAAMVLAGFRERLITVQDDPEKAAKRLALHFKGERLRALIIAFTEVNR
jgi:threonine aldolase